jgi:hypothetical protein
MKLTLIFFSIKEEVAMKRTVIALSIIVFVCSILIIPPQARAESSGAAQGALIGGLIGAVIGTIACIISVSSETPMDKNKPEKADNNPNLSFNDLSVNGGSSKILANQEKVKVTSVFPLTLTF